MFDEYPDNPPGYIFNELLSKKETTLGGTDVFILGSKIHPENRINTGTTTISEENITNPRSIDDFKIGNIIAIDNVFTESNGYDLYVLTSPYEVNSYSTKKHQLLPLDDDLEPLRLYLNEEKEKLTVSTKVGRIENVNLYPVPDVIIAEAFGFAEKLVKRKI